ncbi:MAG: glycosyltransferase [Ignavibacteriales bacterium]|nr:glycosyltransferase [Ignavibacteriales bacterium]
MKILFIVDGSLGNPILLSQGFPAMRRNARRGAEFVVLSFESEHAFAAEPGLRERYANALEIVSSFGEARPLFLRNDGSKIRRALRLAEIATRGARTANELIRERGIDVVHCRSNLPALVGARAARGTTAKVLFDNRGLFSEEARLRGDRLRAAAERRNERRLLLRADATVVVSNAFRDYVADAYDLPQSAIDKVVVIPNGFAKERFDYAEADRKRLKNDRFGKRIVVAYAGAVASWHMFSETVEAFIRLRAKRPDAFFLVLTHQGERAKEALHQTAATSDEYLVAEAYGDDYGCLLSLADFGFSFRIRDVVSRVSAPIKFGEYLAAGLPVLLSPEIGDTEAIARENRLGVVVRDHQSDLDRALDDMLALVGEKDTRARCRAYAENNLTVDQTAETYFRLYQKLAKQ